PGFPSEPELPEPSGEPGFPEFPPTEPELPEPSAGPEPGFPGFPSEPEDPSEPPSDGFPSLPSPFTLESFIEWLKQLSGGNTERRHAKDVQN
ncbi:hypothetical protein IMZ48_31540, partial [Candidatus Bathyarchaeota archaeon]|nr:hypothetical protein [Candidatus Bathyarchaeota archaeon]